MILLRIPDQERRCAPFVAQPLFDLRNRGSKRRGTDEGNALARTSVGPRFGILNGSCLPSSEDRGRPREETEEEEEADHSGECE